VTASIGVALHSQHIDGPKAIMMQADLALYRAKDDGGNSFCFHSGELDQQVHLRVNLAEELRTAIRHNELVLLYQTQVEIRSGRIVGLEALVRWNHPTRGVILPSIFIPIAEHTGGIAALGQWVLTQACRQFREWEDKGLTVPRLAVNVSGAQLRRPSEFERDVAENFTLWGIRRHAIEFELTESVLMEVTQKQSDALEHLRRLGATIAIDDFGTGYSSLKYLTTYHVDRLKIAQELIAGVTSDSRSAVVVRSSIGLAHDLGIEVIAEGVEGEDQAKFLLEAGCEYAQGYHYSRPMPANKVAKLLRVTSLTPLETTRALSTSSAA
jgi:EAL domain-containing protein (putative c-di-GMP-specific phosphodiesterase class I)